MRFLRAVVVLMVLLALGGVGIFLARNQIVAFFLERHLVRELSARLGAEVNLHGLRVENDIVHVARGAVSGGHLPFRSLEIRDVRLLDGWKNLLSPTSDPLHLEVTEIDLVWHDTPSATPTTGLAAPDLDILAGRISFRHAERDDWSLHEVSARLQQTGGVWSIAARDGQLHVASRSPLRIERASLEHRDGAWTVHSFALQEGEKGVIGGSGRRDEQGWSGEFSWQDLEVGRLLPDTAAEHFYGRASGDGTLQEGVFKGRMRIQDGGLRSAPLLLRLAKLFSGEDWTDVPWRTFRFAFEREAGGRVNFQELLAVSPQGLAVRGFGHYAPDSLGATLELGLQREGRPWLNAFVPVLFREEQQGYLWMPVNIGGTPENPTEDVSARVAAAVAAAPVKTAVEAAAEIPGRAVEAAGNLLDRLLGR